MATNLQTFGTLIFEQVSLLYDALMQCQFMQNYYIFDTDSHVKDKIGYFAPNLTFYSDHYNCNPFL